VDLSKPEPKVPKQQVRKVRRSRATGGRHGFPVGHKHSEEHRANITKAAHEVRDRRWKKNAERNKKILERYLEGDVGTVKIAEEFGTSRDVVRRVILQAEKETGQQIMRPPGTTIKNGA
jgi:hypothetical protein